MLQVWMTLAYAGEGASPTLDFPPFPDLVRHITDEEVQSGFIRWGSDRTDGLLTAHGERRY